MPKRKPRISDIPQIQIEYPRFEVITPQTKEVVYVQTMTVAQEKILKGSNISVYTLPNLLNKIVFQCIAEKKPPYNTFEGFLKTFTPNDRMALLYGIYQVSYDNLDKFEVTCNNPMCPKKQYEVNNIPIQNTVTITFYEDETPIKDKVVNVELPISKAKLSLKQYFLNDEANFVETLRRSNLQNSEDFEMLLYIDSLEINTSSGPITYKMLMDLKYVMDRLPSKDRKVLYDTIYEEFTKYGIILELDSICPACGTENKTFINLIGELFRMVQ